MGQRFCQQADVERALGGPAQLLQLLAKTDPNVADPDLVDAVLDAASSEMGSYIQVAVDLGALNPPYPLALVLKTAELAAFHAWRYGAYGVAIPDAIMQGRDAAVRWAQDVGNKRATVGAVRKQNLDQPVGVRDQDPIASAQTDRPGTTKVSVASLKLGFR
jgi:hypothetical protein